MNNLHECKGPSRDQTHSPLTGSQTHICRQIRFDALRGPVDNIKVIEEELYKLHASILILILFFQFVFTMYKLI